MIAALALTLLLGQAPGVETVTFATVAAQDLKMDIYRPEASVRRPLPAILVIHGGAWIGGKREDMKDLAAHLASKGFFAASVDYRLAPKSKYPAMLDDVQTAMRYLRAHGKELGIKTKRIGAMGASAGGHLSLLLGSVDTRDPKPALFPKESSRAQAVFNLFGPVDMAGGSGDYNPQLEPLVIAVLGKPSKDAKEDLKAMSPMTYFNAKSAPTFTIHGEADTLVPVIQAKRLDERLTELKVRHETRLIPKMPHGLPIDRPEVRAAVEEGIEFMRKELSR